VSEGAYESLNFAWSTGDHEERVRENLSRAAAHLGVLPERVFFLSQVHGTETHTISRASAWDDVILAEGDAMMSTDPEVACGVRAADCVPILVGDRRSGAALAIHSGWRGTVKGIVSCAIERLRELTGGEGKLIAAVGPHISLEAFEIGEEVAREIEEGCGVPGAVVRERFPRPHASLRAIVDAQLRRSGVSEIDHVDGCTVTDRTRFFSFRRDGARSGRHLASIVPRQHAL
jgi:polyphenol oxidase